MAMKKVIATKDYTHALYKSDDTSNAIFHTRAVPTVHVAYSWHERHVTLVKFYFKLLYTDSK